MEWILTMTQGRSARQGKKLYDAAGSGKLTQVIAALDKGADIHWKDKNGFTPLITAASFGHLDVVAILLQFGADPNLANKYLPVFVCDGFTPMHWAARFGHRDVVALLMDWGADANLVDQYGRTALNVAEDKGRGDIVAVIGKALSWRRVKNFVLFLHTGGFSSADWSVGLVAGPRETSSSCSITTAGAADDDDYGGGGGGGTVIAPSCGMVGATGIIASRSKSSVLNNRDLCRIVSSYIPESTDRVYKRPLLANHWVIKMGVTY